MPAPLIRSHAAVVNAHLSELDTKDSHIVGAVGLSADGTYSPSLSIPYISSATDVKNAIEIVAQSLRVVETSFAETTYVDQKIADLVNSAPAILDTLGEIAASLGGDANLSVTLVSTIAAENVRATAAEGVLTTDLSGEIARAELAEQGLSTLIADETARAIGEEQMLSTIIAGEIATARAEEQQLSTLIANEKARAIAQEQLISTTIHEEIARAMEEDTTVNSALAQEILRATNAETVLSTIIVTERIRATGEDQVLSTMIATEKSRALTAESDISGNLAAEVTRATQAETGLSSLIAGEKDRAISAELQLRSDLSGEIVRATQAETGLSTLIAIEKHRAFSAEQVLRTDLSSEISRATQAETGLSSFIAVEKARAIAIEQDISGILVSEIERAIEAEAQIRTDMIADKHRAINAENKLRTDLSGEIVRAVNAEEALRVDISNVKVDYLKRDGTLKMTGALDMSGNKIINLSSLPTVAGDAVSLGYYENKNTFNIASTPIVSLGTYPFFTKLTPTDLDVNYSSAKPGQMYRAFGQTASNNTGCVVYTVVTATGSVTANNPGEYRRYSFPNMPAANTLSESLILDLSGNGDGSGNSFTLLNPYDLTLAGNDLRSKYPGFNFFRIPLSSQARHFIYYDFNSPTPYATNIRMNPGDIFEYASTAGQGNYYNRIIYRDPIDASLGGSFNVDYQTRVGNNNTHSNVLFYTNFVSAGTITLKFRKIAVVKNGDLLLKSPVTTQWDIIDVNDPVIVGNDKRIQVRGQGTNLGDYLIDISPEYSGQSTITTVGTVTSGTWNASTIATSRGGTGLVTYNTGDFLVGSSGGLAKIPVGTNGYIMKVVNGNPSWQMNDTGSVAMTTMINGSSNLQATLVNMSTTIAAETQRAVAMETELSTIIVDQITAVIAAAPQALDTLKEIADALGNDPNLATTLISTIGSERDRALLAESGLSSLIADETARALLAESGLSSLIAAGDSDLDAEIQRAELAEAGLSSLIADTKSDLVDEVARAELAESGLSSLIAYEKSRALAAELVLTNGLADEFSRATEAELVLRTDLSGEIDRAELAESGLSSLIATEKARAEAAELVLTNDLAAEVTRAEAAELVLRTDISGEKTRAEAAELVLTNDLAAEVTRAELAESGLSTLIVAEHDRAVAAEGVLAADLAAEVIRATDAESALSQDLAAEVIRATDAESALSQDLAAEVARAEAVESALTSTITAEVTRATAAEDALDGRLDTVESQLTTGTQGQVLKYVDGVAAFAVNDTDGVSISNGTNFPSLTTLQAALDYLFDFSQTRKIIRFVVNDSTEYSSSTTPNADFPSGKVHFINYVGSHTNIYLPPTSQNSPDGTVYRLVHNGNHGDGNYTIKYYNATTSTTLTIFELAPRDTISFIWDDFRKEYHFGVGL